jgi:hypothetical protein
VNRKAFYAMPNVLFSTETYTSQWIQFSIAVMVKLTLVSFYQKGRCVITYHKWSTSGTLCMYIPS